MSEDKTILPFRFPIAVIMQRHRAGHGAWSGPRWEATGVVAGGHVGEGGRQRTPIRSGSDIEQVLWTGLSVVLHKNDLESYRYNLEASTPSVFILCRADGDDMRPVMASMNYDEAGRCLEAGDAAYAVPMPPEMYQWLERYVVENYVTQEPKKRKKESWTGSSTSGQQAERRDRD